MADSTLSKFVEQALREGASRAAIEQALGDAGWSHEQIQDALTSFADVDFRVPVPRPRPQVSARDAFMYLVMFATLYISAYQLGNLLFQFINLGFPDPLTDHTASTNSRIRWAISSLLVAFPVFLFVAHRISHRIAADPAQRNSAIRKWLTYLTMSIAVCVIIGDLISLLNGLLSGELTTRFLLKTLVVGVIAGGIFAYYLWSMRADDEALAQ